MGKCWSGRIPSQKHGAWTSDTVSETCGEYTLIFEYLIFYEFQLQIVIDVLLHVKSIEDILVKKKTGSFRGRVLFQYFFVF